MSLAEPRTHTRQGRRRCRRMSWHGKDNGWCVRLQGGRAFGELSRALVERRREQAAEEGGPGGEGVAGFAGWRARLSLL